MTPYVRVTAAPQDRRDVHLGADLDPDLGADGFVTVAMLGVLLVLLGAGVLSGALGEAAVLRHRAGAAADLAALAAADHGLEGQAAACAAAARIAGAQQAGLSSCALDGGVATVTVVLPGPRLLGADATLHATARAGPG